jgi:hypothetical protein
MFFCGHTTFLRRVTLRRDNYNFSLYGDPIETGHWHKSSTPDQLINRKPMKTDTLVSSEEAPIKGAAAMAFGDEFAYQLWRAPRVLTIALLLPFGCFLLWIIFLFIANLPTSWNYTIQHPAVAAQESIQFIVRYSLSWLPFSLSLYFLLRNMTWLRHRFGLGRHGVAYEINEVGIVSRYDKGFAITMPWALTTGAAKTRRLLLLRARSGWWYLPWRAVNAVDQGRLWCYVQQRVATTKKGPAASA